MKLRRVFLMMALLSLAVACEDDAPTKLVLKTQTTLADSTQNSQQLSVAPVSLSSCLDLFHSYDPKSLWRGGMADLTLDFKSDKSWSEENLLKELTSLSKKAFGELNCPVLTIGFRAPSSDGTYFEGAMSKEDYQSWAKQEISHAEFTRRFEIKKMRTLASLLLKLTEARAASETDSALELAEAILVKNPELDKVRLIKANILLDKEQFVEAASLYEDVLKRLPQNFVAWFNLAYAKRALGSFSEAIVIYQKLQKGLDDYEDAYLTLDDVNLNLTDAYLSNNQLSEAETTLAQVSSQDFAAYAILKANLLRAQKKFAEAKAVLENWLTAHDSNVARFNLILVDLDLQDAEGAKKNFEILKASDPALVEELKFISVFQ